MRVACYDGGKQIKGRKRHVLVDTLGLLLSVEVTPANTSDQAGAHRLLIGLKPLQPWLELIWTASAYSASRSPPGVRPKASGGWRSSNPPPTSRGLSSDPGAGLWNARWAGWGGSAA
jgi:transposase